MLFFIFWLSLRIIQTVGAVPFVVKGASEFLIGCPKKDKDYVVSERCIIIVIDTPHAANWA